MMNFNCNLLFDITRRLLSFNLCFVFQNPTIHWTHMSILQLIGLLKVGRTADGYVVSIRKRPKRYKVIVPCSKCTCGCRNNHINCNTLV